MLTSALRLSSYSAKVIFALMGTVHTGTYGYIWLKLFCGATRVLIKDGCDKSILFLTTKLFPLLHDLSISFIFY